MAISLLIARIGDPVFGFCSIDEIPIGGVIQSGASKTYCEGARVARVGDVVLSDCGHTGTIVSGATSVYAEGNKVARVNDSFSGVYSGTITGSASKTYAS